MMNNLNITHKGSNKLYDQMTIRLAQQSFLERRISRSLNNNLQTTGTENVEAYSANIDFAKSVGEKHTLYYGFESVFNDVKSSAGTLDVLINKSEAGPARYPYSNWTSVADYVNDKYKINEKFCIQTGIRYNYFILNADFSNNLCFYPFTFSEANISNGLVAGSVGAVYRRNKKWVLSANLGTGFRSTNVDDIGKVFDSEAGSVIVPNTNLKAENAYNVDFGVAKVFGDVSQLIIPYWKMPWFDETFNSTA